MTPSSQGYPPYDGADALLQTMRVLPYFTPAAAAHADEPIAAAYSADADAAISAIRIVMCLNVNAVKTRNMCTSTATVSTIPVIQCVAIQLNLKPKIGAKLLISNTSMHTHSNNQKHDRGGLTLRMHIISLNSQQVFARCRASHLPVVIALDASGVVAIDGAAVDGACLMLGDS